MRRILILSLLILTGFTLPPAARAQDNTTPAAAEQATETAVHFYRLEFVVRELDAAGKPVNSRAYTTTVNTDRHFTGSIRTGSKIPIATGSYSDATKGALVNTQFQYQDVGVNFDMMHGLGAGRALSLDLSAEVSSVASTPDPNLHQPVIRRNSWRAPVLVPIGKATAVFRSDSLDSKGAIEVTLTATPLP